MSARRNWCGSIPVALPQVKEPPLSDSPQTVDQALARAESDLVNGRLADAAATLEKGLEGSSTCLWWSGLESDCR